MKRWKYVGVHDGVDLTGVGTVMRGESFDSDLDLSDRDDFQLVSGLSSLKVPELRDRAASLGIDPTGLNKSDLIAAITEKES